MCTVTVTIDLPGVSVDDLVKRGFLLDEGKAIVIDEAFLKIYPEDNSYYEFPLLAATE